MEASGWMIDEPSPIKATAVITIDSWPAKASRIRPVSVEIVPMLRYQTLGRRSNTTPNTGWKTDAQIWYTRVISPICEKVSPRLSRITG